MDFDHFDFWAILKIAHCFSEKIHNQALIPLVMIKDTQEMIYNQSHTQMRHKYLHDSAQCLHLREKERMHYNSVKNTKQKRRGISLSLLNSELSYTSHNSFFFFFFSSPSDFYINLAHFSPYLYTNRGAKKKTINLCLPTTNYQG